MLLSLRWAGPPLTLCICVHKSLITTRVRTRGCRGGRRTRPASTYTDIEGTGIATISCNRPVRSSLDRPQPEYPRQAPNIMPARVPARVRPQRHVHQPTKQLNCGTLNVHSLPRKLEALKELASDLDILVLCLTETWLDDDSVDLRRLRTQGYQVLERARTRLPQTNTRMARSTNHGGVAIIAPNEIRLTKLSFGTPKSFEHLCASVTSKGSSVVVLLLYRPGSTAATQDFFTELSSMMESLAVLTDPVVVTGDINIRLDRLSDPLCTQFKDIIVVRFHQPTNDEGGILDAVITRSDL